MVTSNKDSIASPKDSEATDDSQTNIRTRIDKNRRYLDVINSTGRTLNLSRRDVSHERRINILTSYSGTARRKITDRREYQEDRRID